MPKIPLTFPSVERRVPVNQVPRTEDMPMASPRLMAQGAVGMQELGQGAFDLGTAIVKKANEIQEIKDRSRSAEALNQYRQDSRDYVIEKSKLEGDNALDLQVPGLEWHEERRKAIAETLENNTQKQWFNLHALSEMDQAMNALARHEIAQVQKYRNDTVGESRTNAQIEIDLAGGDDEKTKEIIQRHKDVISNTYPEQDPTTIHQRDEAVLLKQQAVSKVKFAETLAYKDLKNKIASGELTDVNAAITYLQDPANYPTLRSEQRGQLAGVLRADVNWEIQKQKQIKEDTASRMLAEYDKIRRGNGSMSMADWHTQAQELVSKGMMDDSIMKFVISLSSQEEASRRLYEDRGRTHDPWVMDDPQVVGPFMQQAAVNPSAIDITKAQSLVGRGMSWQTFMRVKSLKEEGDKAVWMTPMGKATLMTIRGLRSNNKFDTDEWKNNEGFLNVFDHMATYLKNNPNATADQVNKEVKTVTENYRRGRIRKTIDQLTNIYGNVQDLLK